MKADELIRELPKGLLMWYEFQKGKKALYVASEANANEPLEEALREAGLMTDVQSVRELDAMAANGAQQLAAVYDYIVLAGALERSVRPEALLGLFQRSLSREGRLLLGMDNRLGIRYFCGDRDAFTERSFDGIENYTRMNVKQLEGRSYAKREIAEMLKNAGFSTCHFYSVLPELARPQIMFAEDYLPEEELDVRITPEYHYPDSVFLEEERLYTTLIQNGLFHIMANAYLIECPVDQGAFANAKQITVSMERGKENAMFTIIRRDGQVEKRAAYPEGQKKLQSLMENNRYLKEHGVKMVDARVDGNAYVMPYVRGQAATDYLRELLCRDTELFLSELDHLWELIQHSSEHVPYEEVDWERFEPGWQKRKADDPNRERWKKVACGTKEERENLGIILKRGYYDLVPLNCFYVDGEPVFFDQELYVENLPAKVILYRAIKFIYLDNMRLEQILPEKQVLRRYCMEEYEELWRQFVMECLDQLKNDTELAPYYKCRCRDMRVLHSNRQKMNYPVDEYERIFRDIFRGAEGRQIYLFGSGKFTKKFLSQFRADYEIAGILDNNSETWGERLNDLPVYPPTHLCTLPSGSYKVIICIKHYMPVMKQLKEMGIRDFSIYDGNLQYPRKNPAVLPKDKEEENSDKPKKYHIGYIAGVFDLFHVGHLNMFRRAKEQCDYLIAGVVSDESVMKNKKTMPFIPFEERIEMVRSCKYVDEAVEIPADYGDTDEAYRRYQFDVQFSGSDYADDPIWLAKKAYLQKQGADMVFFPYTESTSSSKIKELIDRKLM